MALTPGADQVSIAADKEEDAKFSSYTASHTLIPATDRYVKANATLGNINFTLPSAASSANVVFYIIRTNTSNNTVTLTPDGTDTINGSSSARSITLIYEFVEVMSDGTQWLVIEKGEATPEFVTLTSSTVLQPVTQQKVFADPSGGSLILTLPDATNLRNDTFLIKRAYNAIGNTVTVQTSVGQTIDETSSPFIMSFPNEYVELVSDGLNWLIINQKTQTAASIALSGSATASQTVTATPTKLNIFDTNILSSPGKCEADQANGVIEVQNIFSTTYDIYEVSFSGAGTFANNDEVLFQVYVDGVAAPIGADFTFRGGTNPGLISVSGIILLSPPTVPQDIEIRVSTTTSIGSNLVIQEGFNLSLIKIGGC